MSTVRRAINAVRQPKRAWQWLFPHDYTSPNLTPVPEDVNRFFRHKRRGRSRNSILVLHTQEFDSRFPAVGLATKDESLLLYNLCGQFQGQDMLEIGCWIGWSTLVLAMGGVRLTVIDPVLGETAPGETCRQAIKEAGLADSVKFIGGFSPQEVTKLNAQGYTWSLCFIDGNHDGDAPLLDAQEVVHSA